jgi:hypothetical protein
MTLDFKKECPQCHQLTGEYHLMMIECDNCVNINSEHTKNAPEKYIEHAIGILVLNPKFIEYQESLNAPR